MTGIFLILQALSNRKASVTESPVMVESRWETPTEPLETRPWLIPTPTRNSKFSLSGTWVRRASWWMRMAALTAFSWATVGFLESTDQ